MAAGRKIELTAAGVTVTVATFETPLYVAVSDTWTVAGTMLVVTGIVADAVAPAAMLTCEGNCTEESDEVSCTTAPTAGAGLSSFTTALLNGLPPAMLIGFTVKLARLVGFTVKVELFEAPA